MSKGSEQSWFPLSCASVMLMLWCCLLLTGVRPLSHSTPPRLYISPPSAYVTGGVCFQSEGQDFSSSCWLACQRSSSISWRRSSESNEDSQNPEKTLLKLLQPLPPLDPPLVVACQLPLLVWASWLSFTHTDCTREPSGGAGKSSWVDCNPWSCLYFSMTSL